MSELTKAVDSPDFQAEVLESELPVLVDFWAEWCGPCKMIAPVVAEIASDYEGSLRVVKVDADENQDIMMRYGIMSIPTLILFKNGEPVEKVVGFRPKDKLMSQFSGHLN